MPNRWKPVFKSEAQPVVKGQQNWREAHLDTNMLCNGDKEKDFRIDFMEARNDGNHKLIGSVTTNLASNGQSLNTSLGYGSKVECVKFSVEPVVNFIEYIFGGC